MSYVPRIALTSGEPAGIGPDICLKLAQHPPAAELIVLADPALLEQRAQLLGLDIKLVPAQLDQPATAPDPGECRYFPSKIRNKVTCGQLDTQNAGYVVEMLSQAADWCQSGICDALVTGPVQKSIINDAGIPFSGHTEFFAERCGGYPVMLLATDAMRVALVTTHLPLHKVSAAITPKRLRQVIDVLHHDLIHRFGISSPKIAVCGLNPHSGEGGHLGTEEIEIIEPTLKTLREKRIHLSEPLPADTVFNPPVLKQYDVVLAMYHDQGLPTLKYAGFGQAVNITLGLPIIRTSVDHGTALDLAGTGQARENSLLSAARKAIEMIEHSHAF